MSAETFNRIGRYEIWWMHVYTFLHSVLLSQADKNNENLYDSICSDILVWKFNYDDRLIFVPFFVLLEKEVRILFSGGKLWRDSISHSYMRNRYFKNFRFVCRGVSGPWSLNIYLQFSVQIGFSLSQTLRAEILISDTICDRIMNDIKKYSRCWAIFVSNLICLFRFAEGIAELERSNFFFLFTFYVKILSYFYFLIEENLDWINIMKKRQSININIKQTCIFTCNVIDFFFIRVT